MVAFETSFYSKFFFFCLFDLCLVSKRQMYGFFLFAQVLQGSYLIIFHSLCIFESANIGCSEVSHKDGRFYSEKQLNYLRCPSCIFLPSFDVYRLLSCVKCYEVEKLPFFPSWRSWLWLFKVICEGEYLSCFVATLCLILQLPVLGLGPWLMSD